MCGRYRRRSDKQKIAEVFHAAVGDLTDLSFAPDDDIRPTTTQPIIRANRDTGDRELVAARWGFVPSWQKPREKFPPTTFNARSEGIEKAGMWRNAFARHRCLVPADSFYEWHKIRAKNNPKYEIDMADSQPFAFAGLWGAWKNPETGEWLQSFTIITTDSKADLFEVASQTRLTGSSPPSPTSETIQEHHGCGSCRRVRATWPSEAISGECRCSSYGRGHLSTLA